MKKSVFAIAFVLLSAVSFAQRVKEQDVPEVVKNAFHKKFPKVENLKWDKEGADFEASFVLNKVETSVVLNAKGTILETEVEIGLNQLPKNTVSYINEHYKNQKVKEAAKTTKSDGTLIYEVEIKGKDVLFDANGTVMKGS